LLLAKHCPPASVQRAFLFVVFLIKRFAHSNLARIDKKLSFLFDFDFYAFKNRSVILIRLILPAATLSAKQLKVVRSYTAGGAM